MSPASRNVAASTAELRWSLTSAISGCRTVACPTDRERRLRMQPGVRVGAPQIASGLKHGHPCPPCRRNTRVDEHVRGASWNPSNASHGLRLVGITAYEVLAYAAAYLALLSNMSRRPS